jgi:hypothetical protein
MAENANAAPTTPGAFAEIFAEIFEDLVTVSTDTTLIAETREFFSMLNSTYDRLKGAVLNNEFWTKQISLAGTTVADMYARGNMPYPAYEVISKSHEYLEPLVKDDPLMLYKIVAGLSDATYAKKDEAHGDLLNALFIICILTTENVIFTNDALLADASFIERLGEVTQNAWALKTFVDYNEITGELSVKQKGHADLTKFYGGDKLKRFKQMRSLAAQQRNPALGMSPGTYVVNIAQGLLAIHAYKTAVHGFTCEAPNEGDAVGDSAAIKCHRAMTSANTNANPVKVGEAGRPASNLRVDVTAEGNAEGPVELSPRG